jgi:hypothetical protein
MKRVFVLVFCIAVIPMLLIADNIVGESHNGFRVIVDPHQTQKNGGNLFGNRDEWLNYDDGSSYWAIAWDSAGDGAGVQYMAPYDCVVGSIKVYVGVDYWPDPGGNYITLRIYEEEDRGPGAVVWEESDLWANRAMWNTYEVNVSAPPHFPFSHNMYIFYHQQGAYPNCPSFSADNGCNYPNYSWTYWQLGGGFFNENPSGDWMIRTYVYNEPGVGEWLSHTPIEPELSVRTITTGIGEITFTLHEPAHVELYVYDIAGRQRTTLVSQHYAAGTHVITERLDLPAGIYFYNLKTDTGFNIAKKFVIVH